MIKVFRASAGESRRVETRRVDDELIPLFLVRLHGETTKLGHPATASTVNARSLSMLCYLSALLCEHGTFDQVRVKFPGEFFPSRETRRALL